MPCSAAQWSEGMKHSSVQMTHDMALRPGPLFMASHVNEDLLPWVIPTTVTPLTEVSTAHIMPERHTKENTIHRNMINIIVEMGGTAGQRLALSPRSKKATGSPPSYFVWHLHVLFVQAWVFSHKPKMYMLGSLVTLFSLDVNDNMNNCLIYLPCPLMDLRPSRVYPMSHTMTAGKELQPPHNSERKSK